MNQEMGRSDNWLIFKKCWSETWASNLTGAQAENCTKGKADGCILPSLFFQLVVHISVRLLAKRNAAIKLHSNPDGICNILAWFHRIFKIFVFYRTFKRVAREQQQYTKLYLSKHHYFSGKGENNGDC